MIATDPGEFVSDSGQSITNAAETLASQVCQAFEIPPDQLRWIERYVDAPALTAYRAGRGQINERWDEVTFELQEGQFRNPDWHSLNDSLIRHYQDRCQPEKGRGFSTPS